MTDVPQVDAPQVPDNGGQALHSMQELQALRLQQASQSAAAMDQEPDDVAKPPTHLDEVDRLKAENLHLRVLISAYKEKDLKQEILNTQLQREELQKQILQQRKEISDKYGIDLNEYEIREGDGAFIPRGQEGVDLQKVLQQMAMTQQPTPG